VIFSFIVYVSKSFKFVYFILTITQLISKKDLSINLFY